MPSEELQRERRRGDVLEAKLRRLAERYRNCQHAMQDCRCTAEARAVMYDMMLLDQARAADARDRDGGR